MRTVAFRLPDEEADRLAQEAEQMGVSLSDYLRMRMATPPIYEAIVRWWQQMGQDPGVWVGVRMRAEGLGMSFDQKLLAAFRMMLDHGLL